MEVNIGFWVCLKNEDGVYGWSKEMGYAFLGHGRLIGGVLEGQGKVAFFHKGLFFKCQE